MTPLLMVDEQSAAILLQRFRMSMESTGVAPSTLVKGAYDFLLGVLILRARHSASRGHMAPLKASPLCEMDTKCKHKGTVRMRIEPTRVRIVFVLQLCHNVKFLRTIEGQTSATDCLSLQLCAQSVRTLMIRLKIKAYPRRQYTHKEPVFTHNKGIERHLIVSRLF